MVISSHMVWMTIASFAVGADAGFLDPVTNYFADLFRSYGDLGPTLKPYNVTLRNTKFIYRTINREPAASTLVWPSDEIKQVAGEDAWGDWKPTAGMTASVLFGWGSGQKWLLHIVEDDKYMVVRDPVISPSWKAGKKFWFDHHVHPNDPRHIDNINKRAEEQKKAQAEKKKPSSGGGKCNGVTTGKGELPPTWVMVMMGIIFCCLLGLGAKTFAQNCSPVHPPAASPKTEQTAGESTAENAPLPNVKGAKTADSK
jgi:hypothetical protein